MAYLRNDLEEASLKTSRICHSTGKIIVKEATRASRKSMICRGSRNYQLHILHGFGFLEEPTDECWAQKQREIQQHESKK